MDTKSLLIIVCILVIVCLICAIICTAGPYFWYKLKLQGERDRKVGAQLNGIDGDTEPNGKIVIKIQERHTDKFNITNKQASDPKQIQGASRGERPINKEQEVTKVQNASHRINERDFGEMETRDSVARGTDEQHGDTNTVQQGNGFLHKMRKVFKRKESVKRGESEQVSIDHRDEQMQENLRNSETFEPHRKRAKWTERTYRGGINDPKTRTRYRGDTDTIGHRDEQIESLKHALANSVRTVEDLVATLNKFAECRNKCTRDLVKDARRKGIHADIPSFPRNSTANHRSRASSVDSIDLNLSRNQEIRLLQEQLENSKRTIQDLTSEITKYAACYESNEIITGTEDFGNDIITKKPAVKSVNFGKLRGKHDVRARSYESESVTGYDDESTRYTEATEDYYHDQQQRREVRQQGPSSSARRKWARFRENEQQKWVKEQREITDRKINALRDRMRCRSAQQMCPRPHRVQQCETSQCAWSSGDSRGFLNNLNCELGDHKRKLNHIRCQQKQWERKPYQAVSRNCQPSFPQKQATQQISELREVTSANIQNEADLDPRNWPGFSGMG